MSGCSCFSVPPILCAALSHAVLLRHLMRFFRFVLRDSAASVLRGLPPPTYAVLPFPFLAVLTFPAAVLCLLKLLSVFSHFPTDILSRRPQSMQLVFCTYFVNLFLNFCTSAPQTIPDCSFAARPKSDRERLFFRQQGSAPQKTLPRCHPYFTSYPSGGLFRRISSLSRARSWSADTAGPMRTMSVISSARSETLRVSYSACAAAYRS